jgi:hypothetical protein
MKNKKKKIKKKKQPETLPEFLALLPDFRRGQGRMHELNTILLIVIMAIMSGCFGQRAAGDFTKKHKKDLIKALKPKNNRLPSRQTIGRAMQNSDYDKLTEIFFNWAKTVVPISKQEWMSLDGKAIHGTTRDASTAEVSFTNLVSLFSSKSKQVITQGKVENKTNEIPLVAQLVRQLGLKGLILTADALHCQKDTVNTIVSSENDYVIGVKGNQETLHEQLKKIPKVLNLSAAKL